MEPTQRNRRSEDGRRRAGCAALVWRTWARADGVPLFDLFPVFMRSARADSVLANDFIPHDVHWTAAGHRLVAAGLLTTGLADTIEAALGRTAQVRGACGRALP